MALIECPECGGKVSDRAPTCPHCGYPIKETIEEKEKAKREEKADINKAEKSGTISKGQPSTKREEEIRIANFKKLTSAVALSDLEIDNAIKNGLLSPKVKTIITKPDRKGTYIKRDKRLSGTSFGAKYSFVRDSGTSNPGWDSCYITDYYLICCLSNYSFERLKKSALTGKYMDTYSKPDPIVVIPLKYVDSIKLEFEGVDLSVPSYTNVSKQKNPVKGAVAGGIIAGPTGAVIGAAATSGTKTKMVQTGSYKDSEIYSLVIKVKNCEPFYVRKAFEINSNSSSAKKPIDIVIETNKDIAKLIEKAKVNS